MLKLTLMKVMLKVETMAETVIVMMMKTRTNMVEVRTMKPLIMQIIMKAKSVIFLISLSSKNRNCFKLFYSYTTATISYNTCCLVS